MSRGPAIGLLELSSIARGIVATDAMAKRAPVEIVRSQTVCPGKYIVLIGGNEEPVRESMEIGVHYAGATLVDYLVIPNLHAQVLPALAAVQPLPALQAVGIVETFSVATTVMAADAACKAAAVTLIEIRLGTGLGGKAYVTMSGDQFDVEASLAAALGAIDPVMLVRSEIIPAPHPDLSASLL
jgi:microcompartment protein CcmL/EutN